MQIAEEWALDSEHLMVICLDSWRVFDLENSLAIHSAFELAHSKDLV